MSTSFAITASPESATLNREPGGIQPSEITFTVTNTSQRRLTGRAVLEPRGVVESDWLEQLGEIERDFEPGATHTFTVRVSPPTDASPGRHAFRLNMVDVNHTDEGEVEGPDVAFEVPEPASDEGSAVPLWLIIAIAAVVVVGGGLVLAFVIWPSGEPTEAEVPRLIGQSETAAAEAAEAEGFSVQVAEETMATDEVAPGMVAAQQPEAETIAAKQTPIEITLAKAPLKAPDLIGKTPEEAEQILSDLQLQLNRMDKTVNPTGSEIADGRIALQTPDPGTELEPNDQVTVFLKGPGNVSVPDVEGFDQRRAERALRAAGLEPTISGRKITGRHSVGEVVEQSPEALQMVEAGAEISLVLEAESVEVPNLRNKNINDALQTLAGKQLAFTISRKISNEDVGTVLSQAPNRGERVEPGSVVKLTVASRLNVRLPDIIRPEIRRELDIPNKPSRNQPIRPDDRIRINPNLNPNPDTRPSTP